jgi:hypothetical protein
VTGANRYLPKSPSPNTKRATAGGDSAARVSETPTSHTPQTDKYVVIEISNSEELEERRDGDGSSDDLSFTNKYISSRAMY